MARKLNVNRAAVAGSVAAISVTALATGLLLSPAQATDNTTNSTNSTNNTPDVNGQLGPMGDHGRGGHGGPGMNSQYGERIYSDRTVKLADGSTV
ncbi:MAG: hypothetical protein RL410_659, partial [Actinomycetota bacterium]